MLVVAFAFGVFWGGARAAKVGLPQPRFQDMVLWIIIAGFVGARILYMIQYSQQFQDKSIGGLAKAFFQIWKGGIIFYGSALGGTIGYGLFYWFVLRRMNINKWQLADAVAPILALGLAIGRVGCLLNGCCWGQVANEETCPVPLGTIHFPLLSAHAQKQLVETDGLQTSIGFGIQRHSSDDPRTVVAVVESGSAAAAAGVKVGDRIVSVNGQPNACILEFLGQPEKVDAALAVCQAQGGQAEPSEAGASRPAAAAFDRLESYTKARADLTAKGLAGTILTETDSLDRLVRWDWPRGRNDIDLVVQREGKDVPLPSFTPRTVGFYPTQIYETVSMLLLMALLLAVYPFRRHDGQLMTLLMIGYALHRFINESLRIEPAVGSGLTLSQWGSVIIFTAGVAMEVCLWIWAPSRWKKKLRGTETSN